MRGLRVVERAVEKALVAEPAVEAPPSAEASTQTLNASLGPSLSTQTTPREASLVVREVAWAMRQTLLEGGQTPFHWGGLQVYQDLDALGQTVEECLAKKGMSGWNVC